MSRPPLLPKSDKSLNCYHQKLSWEVSEEDLRSVTQTNDKSLVLQIKTRIPESLSTLPSCFQEANPSLGGVVLLNDEGITFQTWWPKNVDHNKIRLDATFIIKIADGSSVSIKCDKIGRNDYDDQTNIVATYKRVKLDPELLCDGNSCFTIEAELKVAQIETSDKVRSEELDVFVKDIESIFNDLKTSDVTVIAGHEKFYCHKNILSARCEVFKNMLAPNTVESETNSIEIKDIPAEAVKNMLKYIYSGEIPNDDDKLTLDLLNAAEMYLLHFLKEACLKSHVNKLDVSSCISTFIMADRYGSSSGNLREVVIEFMKCKIEEVMETEDWDKFFDNHLALAKELMKAMMKGSKEKHKCQFCLVSYE